MIVVRAPFDVLLVQRARSMNFFGGAFAFPGGRVEAADLGDAEESSPWDTHLRHPASPDGFSGDLRQLAAAYRRAALREVREEVGLELAPRALSVWARWITPEIESKRFDTLFFFAEAPAATEINVDGTESVAFRWMQPRAALEACDRETIALPPPTQVVLAELAAAGSLDRARAQAQAQAVPEIMPVLTQEPDGAWLALPGDPRHPEPARRPWPQGMPTAARVGSGRVRFLP